MARQWKAFRWWILAWVALTLAGAVAIARLELAQLKDAFETNARIMHRLLSQRVVQHDAILATLAGPHPDIAERATRMELTRYGHAMAVPEPGMQEFLHQISRLRLSDKRQQLLNGERFAVPPIPATARLLFAHADWSGYSVFEEAFTRGHAAGLAAAAAG